MILLCTWATVSEACQINDLDLEDVVNLLPLEVSEACQINDLDLDIVRGHHADNVSEACQINDLDHRESRW